MSGVNFWHIDAHNEGHPAQKVADGRPIFLYLDGTAGFVANRSKKNLNQALRSILLEDNINCKDYELYVPTLTTEATSVFHMMPELRQHAEHAKEIVNFLMPKVPATLGELKLLLSRLTIVGYSHGCEVAQDMVEDFRERLTQSERFTPEQVDEALGCLGIVNIGKSRAYNLAEYKPVPTYTVASTEDQVAYPSRYCRDLSESEDISHWKMHSTARLSHTFNDNHLVVHDATGDKYVRAVHLETSDPTAQRFASRLDDRRKSDWEARPVGKYTDDGHHLYLYTNTDQRLIRSKATEVFQSMASAPVTVNVIQKLVNASIAANGEPRDAAGILQEVEREQLSPENKKLLASQLERSMNLYKGWEENPTGKGR